MINELPCYCVTKYDLPTYDNNKYTWTPYTNMDVCNKLYRLIFIVYFCFVMGEGVSLKIVQLKIELFIR